MKVDSVDFGTIEVDADKMIEFPEGLLGFPECKRFAIVHQEASSSQVFTMQSVDDRAIAFSVATPDTLDINYELTLSDEEVAQIGLTSPQDVLVAVILLRNPEEGKLSANLSGPLVINTATRKGFQKVIANLGCGLTLRSL